MTDQVRKHPKKCRWKRRCFTASLSAIALYVASYAILSLTGGWVIFESGELRPFGGFAAADIYLWQPRYGSCQWFRTISGDHTFRGDALGLFYAPLILLDQRSIHRTIRFLPPNGRTPDQSPPPSDFNPRQENPFHGRNRY